MNAKFDDNQPLTEIDQAWINLARQRAAEIRAGTARTFPADQVIDEARQSLAGTAPVKGKPYSAFDVMRANPIDAPEDFSTCFDYMERNG